MVSDGAAADLGGEDILRSLPISDGGGQSGILAVLGRGVGLFVGVGDFQAASGVVGSEASCSSPVAMGLGCVC